MHASLVATMRTMASAFGSLNHRSPAGLRRVTTLLGTASTPTLHWRWLDPGAELPAATVLAAVRTIVFRDVARVPASER